MFVIAGPRAAVVLVSVIAAAAAGCEGGRLTCSGEASLDGHCAVEGADIPAGGFPGEGEGEGEGGIDPPPGGGEGEGVGGEGEGEGEAPGPVEPPPDRGDCGSELAGRAAPELSAGAGGPAGGYEDVIEIEGMRHPYTVIVPACDNPGAALGVAIVLHAANADRDYVTFKWRGTAASRGYVVVVPEGRRTFNNQAVWGENVAHNLALIGALLTKVESEYAVATNDTIIAGLGAGATFAGDLAAQDDTGSFEYLFAVNPSLYDQGAEDNVKAFLLAGEREAADLVARGELERFRYEFVPTLGRWYPGPAYPELPDDPGDERVTNETAIDWFHGP